MPAAQNAIPLLVILAVAVGAILFLGSPSGNVAKGSIVEKKNTFTPNDYFGTIDCSAVYAPACGGKCILYRESDYDPSDDPSGAGRIGSELFYFGTCQLKASGGCSCQK
jgi:hypothetical protein